MENSASIHLEYQNPYDNYYWIMDDDREETMEEESPSEESDGEDKPTEDEGSAPDRDWIGDIIEIRYPFAGFQ